MLPAKEKLQHCVSCKDGAECPFFTKRPTAGCARGKKVD